MRKILFIITAILLLTFLTNVYAECETFILPRETQEEPFHKYGCVNVYPVFFGRIETDIDNYIDVNLSYGDKSISKPNVSVSNQQFFINFISNDPISTSLNTFFRITSRFNIEDEEVKVVYPRFSLYR